MTIHNRPIPILQGESDNDILRGGNGNDTLTGDMGADSATDFTPSQGDSQDGTIP